MILTLWWLFYYNHYSWWLLYYSIPKEPQKTGLRDGVRRVILCDFFYTCTMSIGMSKHNVYLCLCYFIIRTIKGVWSVSCWLSDVLLVSHWSFLLWVLVSLVAYMWNGLIPKITFNYSFGFCRRRRPERWLKHKEAQSTETSWSRKRYSTCHWQVDYCGNIVYPLTLTIWSGTQVEAAKNLNFKFSNWDSATVIATVNCCNCNNYFSIISYSYTTVKYDIVVITRVWGEAEYEC